MLPAAVEQIPQDRGNSRQEGENRPIMPEELHVLGQFVDRVERRMIQIKEEAAREVEERLATARAEDPCGCILHAARSGWLKEHIFNILTEAGYETVGHLMFDMKTDARTSPWTGGHWLESHYRTLKKVLRLCPSLSLNLLLNPKL
jgi:hypothetical protein